MSLRVLITGRGSIARRHLSHLRALEPEALVSIVAAGPVDSAFEPCEVVPDFAAGLAWRPDAVVVASVSSRHATELAACLERGLPCLVEKPLLIANQELAQLLQVAVGARSVPVQVGCNLRQLPVLRRIRHLLADGIMGRMVRAQLEVGQDLRQWRPGRDFAASYSAIPAHGGGVVFDLVHEVDMALWLLGPLRLKGAAGGHLSSLATASDDVHTALLVDARGAPVVVSLDYVSPLPVRRYAFVGELGRLEVDLIARELRIAEASGVRCLTLEPAEFDIAQTYRTQMIDWMAAVRDRSHRLSSPLEDGLRTTELMLAMKEAQ